MQVSSPDVRPINPYLAAPIPDADRWKDVTWVGALSFEERCMGAMIQALSEGVTIRRAYIADYSNSSVVDTGDGDYREYSKNILLEYEKSGLIGELVFYPVNAYSVSEWRWMIAELSSMPETFRIIFDITCITKIHAIALATICDDISPELLFCYTRPDNYGVSTDGTPNRWRDVLISPFVDGATIDNEESGRGLILCGFESDRIVVALSELEPRSGSLVFGRMEGRPDQFDRSRSKNRNITRRLVDDITGAWESVTVDVFSYNQAQELIVRDSERAKLANAPLILYPFGPKPLVFNSALAIKRAYPEGGWFVYTVPAGYDLAYSEGVSTVVWMTYSER